MEKIVLKEIKNKEIDFNAIFNSNEIRMTSREVALLTGKQHKNIIRDMENIFTELRFEPSIYLSEYVDSTGRKLKQYILPKNEILCLISGYSIGLRMAIIKRLDQLERKNGPSLNTIISSLTILEDEVDSNGSEWGKMGVQQKVNKAIMKKAKKDLKSFIQPDLLRL